MATGLTVAEGESNAAGISRLRLIPSDLLTVDLPDPIHQFGLADLFIDSRSIYLNDDADFVDMELIPDYASYSEDPASNDNGALYNCNIQIVIPKDRRDVTAWIHRNREKRWIALIQDRNGNCRMVGTIDQPLSLSVKNTLGNKTGRNSRSLALNATSIMPALYLDSVESKDLFGTYEFDFSFSYDFNT